MLNKDTLELIIAHALAAQSTLPQQLTPVAALPKGIKLHNLEQFEPGRVRFRGNLATSSLADFASYVRGHADDEVAGFIDQDAMACRVFFNLGTTAEPGHGDDTALLTLKPTAAYKAMCAIAGKPVTQRDLAEWMEDWSHCLKAFAGSDSLPIATACAAVRNITIKAGSERTHTEHNFGAARSAMDEIEAKSQDRLPTELLFVSNPYDGLLSQNFTLRLSVITGDKPLLKLRWVREEAQREEIAQDFKRALQQELLGDGKLLLGTFAIGA